MSWTQADIAEIRRIARNSTPGPFSFFERRNYAGFQGAGYPVRSTAILDDLGNVPHTQAGFSSLGDAKLYITARQSLLSLADEVEQLQRKVRQHKRPQPRWKGRAEE